MNLATVEHIIRLNLIRDLRHVSGLFWGVRFTPSIKLTTMTGLSIEFKVSAEN
jgi:hypothetical protein